jgi:pimeloyl-ACP methyl ester carboxylesterase
MAGQVFGDFVDGPGPLVVGLPGWGRDWRDLQIALGRFHHLLLDLPGFGTSPPPSSVWGALGYADCVASVIDEQEVSEPIVLVGHSFGGRVALCLAASRPEMVRGVVLCGVPFFRSVTARRPSRAYRLARRARRLRLISSSQLEAVRRATGSADYLAAHGIMRLVFVRLVNESYQKELTLVRCPAALLWGREDTAAPVLNATKATELMHDDVRLVILDGIGHDVHLQAPQTLAALVDQMMLQPRKQPC